MCKRHNESGPPDTATITLPPSLKRWFFIIKRLTFSSFIIINHCPNKLKIKKHPEPECLSNNNNS